MQRANKALMRSQITMVNHVGVNEPNGTAAPLSTRQRGRGDVHCWPFAVKVARIPAGSTLPSLLIQTRTYTPPDIYAPFGVSGLVPFSHCDRLKVER
ncbi:hypothetical protein EVAR_49470_1 [Eumeta japonica]|uniref:Uncharacterized protein n=1 Tax=Eumeta variegata TaxID=151549 RepID=A0A4C1Y5R1_EUMVA|nr:hypothetical protein EVAR_49470_1 [Eumeta japonica]